MERPRFVHPPSADGRWGGFLLSAVENGATVNIREQVSAGIAVFFGFTVCPQQGSCQVLR